MDASPSPAAALVVPRVEAPSLGDEAFRSVLLDAGAHLAIGIDNWPDREASRPSSADAGLPRALLRLAHDGESLLLLFQVEEDGVRAVNGTDQGPVWQDSCVELFATILDGEGSPASPAGYYNFEFNAVGTLLSYFGPDREDRKPQDARCLAVVERLSSLGRDPFGFKPGVAGWELRARIPAAAFGSHGLENLDGRLLAINAYKCGDELPEPHYLSWAPIATENPDFHRPEFFRTIRLAKG